MSLFCRYFRVKKFLTFCRSAGYTTIWNVLDYSSLVIPTGLHVDPALDSPKPAHEFYSPADKDNYELCEIALVFC